MSPQSIDEALIAFAHSMLALGHNVSAVEVPRETFLDFVACAYDRGLPQPTHPKVALIPRRLRSFLLSWSQGPDPMASTKTTMIAVDRNTIEGGLRLHVAGGPLWIRMPLTESAKMLEEYSL